MNYPILFAAVLSTLTLLAHFFGGGPQYHTPAMLSNLSVEDKAIYTILWHGITALLAINSIALALALKKIHRAPLIYLVNAQYLAFAGLFVFFGYTRTGSLWLLPQWIAFALIAALAFWGLQNKQQ